MQAVLTHRLFADAEAGEPLSLLCDLDLVALGRESAGEGKSLVSVWWSDSSSILVSPAIWCILYLLLGDATDLGAVDLSARKEDPQLDWLARVWLLSKFDLLMETHGWSVGWYYLVVVEGMNVLDGW